ncbi:MAG: hypothetical protein IKG25_02775 [Mogibacterium sp.]|nr:hypothetical protein [Mogibacterium sp.]
MSYSNGIISAPVSISDIQNVLGVSGGGDLGTLCQSVDINKWAKYKPVVLANVDTVSGQWDSGNNRWRNDATWWKANMCGLSTTIASEFGDISNSNSFAYKLTHGQLGWNYTRPSGGSQSPYREQDFAQYFHDAIAPYGEIGATSIYIDQQGNAQVDWDVVDVDSLNLRLADISFYFNGTRYDLTDFYLGVILYSGSTFHLFTSSTKFTTGASLSVVMTNATSLAGTWNLMPFFTKYQTNSSGTFDANGVFLSMADTQPVNITLTTQGSNHFDPPYGMWNQAGTAVEYSCDIVNETSSSHTYTGIRISIHGNSINNQPIGYVDLLNVTVAGHTTETKTGTISATKSGYSSYWIKIHDLTNGTTIDDMYWQVEDYDPPLEP